VNHSEKLKTQTANSQFRTAHFQVAGIPKKVQ